MHLVSWNVNGIRAIVKKGFEENIRAMKPDVFCLQETKASVEDVFEAAKLFPEYKVFANSSKARKGYSGTAIFSKEEPLNVSYDLGLDEHDQEGRVVAAEYPQFFLVTSYTPNAGEELKRLNYRQTWDVAYREYLVWLQRRKPVIACGDFNVAYQPIDLARPKENYNKSAGYTQQEIDGFGNLLNSGFVDTFRHFHPDEIKYTYWNFIFNGREKNIGWRIDHFLISQKLLPHVNEALIYNEYHGSDHCPVGLKIDIGR
ncbi:MAG: Exodeoxyribonuclease III [Cytophagales bacterium]|jgi:exodeoxyribonuclease-3|nr:exodeoxyribonuclease III [Bacteroidota bacterium]MBS1980549.1 exodeoxyribonuclease III [Bacteroidota bacterium]WHZ07870.1 MAG: Exodeoxyribonuclease III [Cytophagales bacterium]